MKAIEIEDVTRPDGRDEYGEGLAVFGCRRIKMPGYLTLRGVPITHLPVVLAGEGKFRRVTIRLEDLMPIANLLRHLRDHHAADED